MTSSPPAPPGTNDQLSPIRSSRPRDVAVALVSDCADDIAFGAVSDPQGGRSGAHDDSSPVAPDATPVRAPAEDPNGEEVMRCSSSDLNRTNAPTLSFAMSPLSPQKLQVSMLHGRHSTPGWIVPASGGSGGVNSELVRGLSAASARRVAAQTSVLSFEEVGSCAEHVECPTATLDCSWSACRG